MESSSYSIADFYIYLSFSDDAHADRTLLPSLAPFLTTEKGADDYLLRMEVKGQLKPSENGQLLKSFDTGNGNIVVYTLPGGGYEFQVYNPQGEPCSLLRTENRFTQCQCRVRGSWHNKAFGLNNALMLAFAFASNYHDSLLIHASCVAHQPVGEQELWGYPFIAKSGTGKSTHTSLWMSHVEGCQLLNDDNPVVRIIDGIPYIYGSPWSGKTPCYRNMRARLGAVTSIVRDCENRAERLDTVNAFAMMMPACSSMMWDETLHENLCQTIAAIIATTPQYAMHCRPDAEAALCCSQTIIQDGLPTDAK